ncbi:MAG: tetratricopeptide repeat protein [Chloroflexi bacterium]|nr:tetratricopeptide repeat protein [Chloroflexota bacterium]
MAVRKALRKKAGDLRIALLGSPRIERAGREVTFDTRKALAIIAFLALEGGRQPRERLAAMFWPEAETERARGALRRTLSAIRTSDLGDHLEADTASAFLRVERLSIDVLEFRELRAKGDHARAVAAYRGDLLSGFALRDAPEFEEWTHAQARALRSELAESLERLVHAERDAGRLGRALDHARRWLELDPLNEAAHREAMRVHAFAGDRSAAIRQYHECAQLLDRDLGVAPMDETVALYDSIREGKPPREERVSAPAPSSVRNVDEAVGDLYTLHGAYAKAVESYTSALAAAPASARATIERKLAEVFHRRGEWEQAEAHYARAAESDDERERARALADRSLVAHRRGEADRALRFARKALLLAQSARDDRALAQAHNILGIISGDRAHLEKALRLAEGLGDPAVTVAALNNLSLAHLREADPQHALPLAERALRESEALGDRHREAALHNNLADVLRALGRAEEAMRQLKRAATLFSEIGGAREPEVWKLVEW